MSFEIRLERNGHILRAIYAGEVDIAERKLAAIELLKLAMSQGVDRFLLDYRRASCFIGSAPLKYALAQFASDQLDHASARIAWLVVHEHQLSNDVEIMIRDLGVATGRFRSLDAALEWLEADDIEELGPPLSTSSPPRLALALAMAAADLTRPMPPVQFAGVVKLIQELLDTGMTEATTLAMARRMFEIINVEPATRPTQRQERRDPYEAAIKNS